MSVKVSHSCRKPLEYKQPLIERESGVTRVIRNGYHSYLLQGAEDSRCSAKQWYRYLRKLFQSNACILNEAEIAALNERSALSMFQKVRFAQALDPDSVTHQYIVHLNRRTDIPMVHRLLEDNDDGQK